MKRVMVLAFLIACAQQPVEVSSQVMTLEEALAGRSALCTSGSFMLEVEDDRVRIDDGERSALYTPDVLYTWIGDEGLIVDRKRTKPPIIAASELSATWTCTAQDLAGDRLTPPQSVEFTTIEVADANA